MNKNETPVFVRIDNYNDVLDVIQLIRSKLDEAKTTLNKINELKDQEDNEIELWENELEEIERKTKFIDKSLFEPEHNL